MIRRDTCHSLVRNLMTFRAETEIVNIGKNIYRNLDFGQYLRNRQVAPAFVGIVCVSCKEVSI